MTDIDAIVKQVRLPLAHEDGGQVALKLLNEIANLFLRDRLLSDAETEKQRGEWAARIEARATALLEAFDIQQEADRSDASGCNLDLLRRLAEVENPQLAQLGRIVARGDPEKIHRGNPIPPALRGAIYLRDFGASLRRRYGSVEAETRGPDDAANMLVKRLETAFVSLFGASAGVSTHHGRRAGPTVRFMKAFSKALARHREVGGHYPLTAAQLRAWSINDALGDRLAKLRALRKTQGMGR